MENNEKVTITGGILGKYIVKNRFNSRRIDHADNTHNS